MQSNDDSKWQTLENYNSVILLCSVHINRIQIHANDDARAVSDCFWGFHCIRQTNLHPYVEQRYAWEPASVVHVRSACYLL